MIPRTCHECCKAPVWRAGSNRCRPCRDRANEYGRTAGKLLKRVATRRANARIKAEVIAAYGGKCRCCGESESAFLTVDHVDGRKEFPESPRSGKDLYFWLKRNGYPQGAIQLLCYNCNCSRGFLGQCPHEGRPTGRWDRKFGLIAGGRQ